MTANKGYIRVAAASPRVHVADPDYNYLRIVALTHEAAEREADVVVFPELSLTGYTCGDLFRGSLLLEKSLEALHKLADLSDALDITIVVGVPYRHHGRLYNCAAICSGGHIVALIPKTYLPNHDEFYERRRFCAAPEWSEPECLTIGRDTVLFGTSILLRDNAALMAVEICEDMWMPISPAGKACIAGANIVLNLSASNELIGKHQYLLSLIKSQSARNIAGYVYASAGTGESSTDVVFTGNAIIAENGIILKESPRFTTNELLELADIDLDFLASERCNTSYDVSQRNNDIPDYKIIDLHRLGSGKISEGGRKGLLRTIDPHPFVPAREDVLSGRCDEIVAIQTAGLMQRLRATDCKSLVVGISGGLDSTLALLIAVKAFDELQLDRKGIVGITMPGLGTSDRTLTNALDLMELLGVTSLTIPIADAVKVHFRDLGHDETVHDVTYENSQARERTQILMDYANQIGGMVLGTGDLSELALGWCTYNGDHMSMYAVNASIPKTLVRHIVSTIARGSDEALCRCLTDVVDTPISPELIPTDSEGHISQKTEDLVGPYELHDFFLYQMLRRQSGPTKIYELATIAFDGKYDADTIMHWLRTFYRRFFNQQFKRSCMPDGPKVGSVSLSPRGDWRMPSDVSARAWLQELDNYESGNSQSHGAE